MRREQGHRRVTGLLLLAALLANALLVTAQPASKRLILGQVLDPKGKAVASAIVYLKNSTTKEQLTVVTNKDGRYQFTALDMKEDYEIYAESGELKSRTRKVSQFDTRDRIVINLNLQAAEESKKEEKKG
jgi:protocatechuate 3,4-dioxygenase beta subunit